MKYYYFCSLLLAFYSVLLFPSFSSGNWPVIRHDSSRSASTEGKSNFQNMAPMWRYYLGGSIGKTEYLSADINRDGLNEIVFISDGRLLTKRPNDILVWQTPLLNLSTLWGIVDIDNNGFPEIAAAAELYKIYLFDGRDGSILWEIDDDLLGSLSLVQFHDFNDDGMQDIYIANCNCCTINIYSTFAISFANGFNNEEILFYLDRPPACSINEDTYIDADADGKMEIVTIQDTSVAAYSTTDGSLKYDSGDIGVLKGSNVFWTEDVDHNGLPNFFIFNNYSREDIYLPQKRVVSLEYDSNNLNFIVKWQFSLEDIQNSELKYHHRSVSDINGDGNAEVIVSRKSINDNTSMLYILDARDGVIIATQNNAEIMGIADVTADNILDILVINNQNNLQAYDFGSNTLNLIWTINSERPLDIIDREIRNNSNAYKKTLMLYVDNDNEQELLTTAYNESIKVPYIKAWDTLGATPQEVASYVLPTGSTALAWEQFMNDDLLQSLLFIAQSDGFLVILDESLYPTNVSYDPAFPSLGMRIGGYTGASNLIHQTPTTSWQSTVNRVEISVSDSSGNTLYMDPSIADMLNPPNRIWSSYDEKYPNFVDINNDGTSEVITHSRDTFKAHDRDGNLIWDVKVTNSEKQEILFDSLPGNANSDGIPDIFYSTFDENASIRHLNVLNGQNGSIMWPSDFTASVQWDNLPFSIGDINADGVDDILVVINNYIEINGANGNQLLSYPTFTAYDLPLAVETDQDDALEILLEGGHFPIRLLDNDLSEQWVASEDRYTGRYGALVNCATGKKFVTPKFSSSIIRRFDIVTGGIEGEKSCAGGTTFENEPAARAAGYRLGYLSPVNAFQYSEESNSEAAVLGSTDGWLYLLNACNFDLIYSINMGYSVSEPIIDDVDSDGTSEILAIVGDGYLYSFDSADFPSPQWVFENDGLGPALSEAEDIDEIETYSTLWANWYSVPETQNYAYSIVTSGGRTITAPDWINVGLANDVEATDLPLILGGKYFFAVTATGDTGTSFQTLSDGITIIDVSPPTANLTVDPELFYPIANENQNYCTATAQLTDKTSLKRYKFYILNDNDNIVISNDYSEISGLSLNASFLWDGKDFSGNWVEPGIFSVYVVVEDVAGHEAAANKQIEVKYLNESNGLIIVSSGCNCNIAI